MIRLIKDGRRIVVLADRALPGFKTAIPGAYESVHGHWTVPLCLESCALLKQKYGSELQPDNELVRWTRQVQNSRRAMAGLAKEETVELVRLPKAAPRLYAAMQARTYQIVGAAFVAENRATLIADDPGLGKTLIALGGVLEAGTRGPYLVVAPKTASDSVWRREIQRWLPPKHHAVILPETGLRRDYVLSRTKYTTTTWLIVHPEIVLMQEWLTCTECGTHNPATKRNQRMMVCGHAKDRKTKHYCTAQYPKLFEIEWGAVIVDESHETLIRRTGQTTQRRRGLDSLQVRDGGMRIAMSGTPFDSKPHQLWGTLNWLRPDQYSAFYRWAELYWQKGGRTGFEIGEFRKDREPMLWSSLAGIALRRTKAEVAYDLPPKLEVGTPLTAEADSPVGIWLEMTGKQAKAYTDLQELSVAQLDSGRLEVLTALAELTRLKQLASTYGDIYIKRTQQGSKPLYVPRLPSNKFNWLVDALEEWGYPNEPITKVVVVSFYTGILQVFRDELEKHFKTKPQAPLCTAITGRTPQKDRKAIIDRFNTHDHEHIMMLNVKAGGTAITIDSADRMVFLSETRIDDQQLQAEDRIHRVSNPRHCMYYYLRSLGTVDVGTALLNREARLKTHRLLDGRRGVDYVRHVLDLSHI